MPKILNLKITLLCSLMMGNFPFFDETRIVLASLRDTPSLAVTRSSKGVMMSESGTLLLPLSKKSMSRDVTIPASRPEREKAWSFYKGYKN